MTRLFGHGALLWHIVSANVQCTRGFWLALSHIDTILCVFSNNTRTGVVVVASIS